MRLALRALALYGVLAATVFATACSSNGGATPPLDQTAPPLGGPTTPLDTAPSDTTGTPIGTMSTISCTSGGVTGKITSMSTSATKLQLHEASGAYIWVYIWSTTKKTYNGLTPKIGEYAYATGSGNPMNATSVTLSTTAFTCSSSTTTTTATSGVPAHLMTADYFMGQYGTRSVSPSRAAPYLNYAQTSIADSATIRAAGIKTQFYVDAGKLATTNPLTSGLPSSAFAHTCTGHLVYETENGKSFPLADPRSSAFQLHMGAYISSVLTRAKFDMIFQDNSGALSPYGSYPYGKPCNYSDSAWVNGYIAADNTSPIGVMPNGLNTFPSSLSTMYSPTMGLLSSTKVIAGNMEMCYSMNAAPEETGSSWIHIENSELNVIRQHKLFQCMARNTNSASSNIAARKFVLASFLLTYDPKYAILAEEFATASGLHVFPESKLVPMSPVIAAPSSVTSLKTASGTYARQYNACYLGGRLVGACAVVVDKDGTYRFPYSGYTHTLSISGAGVLDGGTVSTSGPAPPSTMTAGQAVIAFK